MVQCSRHQRTNRFNYIFSIWKHCPLTERCCRNLLPHTDVLFLFFLADGLRMGHTVILMKRVLLLTLIYVILAEVII